MVEVTVDAKEMAKLPYDPNDIPDAVKRRVSAVDALYGKDGRLPLEMTIEPAAPPPVSAATALPSAVPSALPATPPALPFSGIPPAPEDPNSNTWKSRALSLQGRFEKEVQEYQNQLTQMGTELLHAQSQQRRQQAAAKPPPPPSFLTREDEQNYGRELMNFAQRAALHAVAPKLLQVEEQNKQLRKHVADQNRRALDLAVEAAVPDYREFDRNPRWHKWLLGVDVMSGRVRQTLLNEAISAGNAPRVVSFFNGFRQEEAATGHSEQAPLQSQLAQAPRDTMINLASLAAPGRARPAAGGDTSLPQDKPTYTRANIRDAYRAHQKGAYIGREADWVRLEADFFAAQREGRIR